MLPPRRSVSNIAKHSSSRPTRARMDATTPSAGMVYRPPSSAGSFTFDAVSQQTVFHPPSFAVPTSQVNASMQSTDIYYVTPERIALHK